MSNSGGGTWRPKELQTVERDGGSFLKHIFLWKISNIHRQVERMI